MPRTLRPLDALLGDQARAADPVAHAALSASAGTGKTHVLTARVLRLLLGGVPPSAILCLTFTKTGAAEMANRIAARLAHWVRLKDADLGQELFAIGEDAGPESRQLARRLFARVLEAPGGLRIQTIHSFAQALLASFPVEAGIAPGFQPLEGRAERELARRTLADLIVAAEAGGDARLSKDVETLSLKLGESGAEAYLTRCAHHLEALEALGDPATIEAQLRDVVALPAGDVEAMIAALCEDDAFDDDLFARLIAANRAWGSGTKAVAIVEALTRWLAASPVERAQSLDTLGRNIITKEGVPCKVSPKQLAADPDYEALAAEFGAWLAGLIALRIKAELVAVQAAGLRAAQAFAVAYARAKRSAGVADFNDLIAWTRRLLATPGMGDWVRFKMDRRTDHILVDEAQDTNADQWAIVDSLAGEYFTGSSESERRWRTLFMVGDFKQAIFGFQGTDPAQFETMRRVFRERAHVLIEAEDASDAVDRHSREFRDLSIDASFRSSPAVLDVVDAVIGELGFAAMGLPEPPNAHIAANARRAGRVELWPPFVPEAAADEVSAGDEEAWLDEPVRLYASDLARRVRTMLAEAPVLASTGRPLSPGDIMILVRSRSEVAALIVARLHAEKVPVAGIDRLYLSRPLAVKDLMAAVRFAVQPLDDLNLANLLVSPLLGWDQDQLYRTAHGRPGRLWPTLQEKAASDARVAAAHAILVDLLNMADYTPPSRFLETILSGPIDGRRKLLRRLGAEARDPIDELLASALTFERSEIGSLDRFVDWFGRDDVEVRREAGESGNVVRVMTVHGAKGLEAPVVILADATWNPEGAGSRSATVALPMASGTVPAIAPTAKAMVDPFDALSLVAKARDLEEHWRLLYVALTRARERLIVAGLEPRRAVENDWHGVVARAMTGLGAAANDLGTLVWTGTGTGTTVAAKSSPRVVPPPRAPDWLRRPAPPESRPPRPLAPSALRDEQETMPPPAPAMVAAARRGTLLHALFERLPDTRGDRRAAAHRWLENSGVDDAAVRTEIAEAAMVIVDHADFADLFGPTALAEAPIAAALPDGRVVAGTVDRLLIDADRIRIVDFKTGRHVPNGLCEVPAAHVRQMRAYAEALAVIFPGRPIEAALLYTAGPRLIALDG